MVSNHLKKKVENPKSSRKFIARCPDKVDAVRDSVGMSAKHKLIKAVMGFLVSVINHYHINISILHTGSNIAIFLREKEDFNLATMFIFEVGAVLIKFPQPSLVM